MSSNKTAIVFIEFQNEFCSEKGFCYPLVQSELARVKTVENGQKLLRWARENNLFVIHCPFVFDPQWYEAHQPGGLQETFYQEKVFQPGSWNAEIIDAMRPLPTETVLSGKRGLSGFNNTGLHELLQIHDIRQLLICGFLTNLCVQATAISAYDLGYRPIIVADACAAGSQQIQEYVEATICPVFGGSMKTDDVLFG